MSDIEARLAELGHTLPTPAVALQRRPVPPQAACTTAFDPSSAKRFAGVSDE